MQTVRQPYELQADNIMEGCVLVALMAAVYFDINQQGTGTDHDVQLNTIMVGLLVLCIVGVWLLQGPGRQKLANLAKAGERRHALLLLSSLCACGVHTVGAVFVTDSSCRHRRIRTGDQGSTGAAEL